MTVSSKKSIINHDSLIKEINHQSWQSHQRNQSSIMTVSSKKPIINHDSFIKEINHQSWQSHQRNQSSIMTVSSKKSIINHDSLIKETNHQSWQSHQRNHIFNLREFSQNFFAMWKLKKLKVCLKFSIFVDPKLHCDIWPTHWVAFSQISCEGCFKGVDKIEHC